MTRPRAVLRVVFMVEPSYRSLPAGAAATAAAAAAAEPAKSTAEAAASAESSTEAAAERPDAARPAAPAAAAPAANTAARSAAHAAEDRDHDEQNDEPPERQDGRRRTAHPRRCHARELNVARLRDSGRVARGGGEQPGTVSAVPELRHHQLARGLSRVAVGDPLLESVADFGPDLPLAEREQDQQTVVFSFLADAAAVVLEQLHGVLVDVAVAVEVGYGGHDNHVPAGGLQRARDAVDLVGALRIDDMGEVVDGCGQLGERR